MSRRPKPPLRWLRAQEGFLDPSPSSWDLLLQAALREEQGRRSNVPVAARSEKTCRAGSANSIDDLMAIVVVSTLGASGVIIGWSLFA
jgi:hypothetical protein